MTASAGLRREVRAAAADGGVPPQHVDEVTDLALHAMERAFEVVGEVVMRASTPQASVCALGIALSLIAQEAQGKAERLVRDAPLLGMTASTATVHIGGENG